MSAPAPALVAEIGTTRYPVHLGAGVIGDLTALWRELLSGAGTAMVVADGAVPAIADAVSARIAAAGVRVVRADVPPGESSKSLSRVEELCRHAAAQGVRRADAVVAVGGGVIGDLAGFVAASYQRGIRLVHVPTTLLAMVDSAIGGKTGVDLPEGKNYVGAVWQPELVAMDIDALATLPPRELSCGYAEVIKYGLLEGPELFDEVEARGPLPGPADTLVALIRRCVEHKLAVVAGDERDLGRRATLNLGHTVGHGIEAAGGYERFRHGEAISLGLLAALRVSVATRGLDEAWRDRTAALLAAHDLPVRLPDDVATDDILSAMRRDKKAETNRLNMVLLRAPGDVVIREDPPAEVVVAAIEELRA